MDHMDQSETNLDIATDPALRALQEEVQSLRNIFIGALVVMIMLSGALNIFLLRQASIAGGQVAESQRFINEFQTQNVPVALDFWAKLQDYTKSHPDFKPILDKYATFMQTPKAPGAGSTTPKR
jgi:hypothetical protein